MKKISPKILPITLFTLSIGCFVLGLINPILHSSMFLGLKTQDIYLFGSVEYFYEEGEWFIGSILLIFTFIFPILKYIVVFSKIIEKNFKGSRLLDVFIEIINKWAMLDVFVVALIIINMKMSSIIIVSKLQIGTTYFAASVILLMTCSLYLKYQTKQIT
ncbi:MAG: paraquat-inducible protein A [Saprospiraceae bacterium]|mgnify:CR=1 FL=1